MKIACIGWGSLIWNPEDLLVEGKWNPDGPLLPVEFLRQSGDGRLTLVLDPAVEPVPTWWSMMTTGNIDEAVESLKVREGCLSTRPIGVLRRTDSAPVDIISGIIHEWLSKGDLDAVIWTNLGPKFNETRTAPSLQQVSTYLNSLTGLTRNRAEEYIRRAPACVATRYRKAIEHEFGWLPIES